MATRLKKTPNPQQMARDEVREFFDRLIGSSEATNAQVESNSLERTLVDVHQALEAEHLREHPDESIDNDITLEVIFAREAGYLVGVQVGLHLRKGA